MLLEINRARIPFAYPYLPTRIPFTYRRFHDYFQCRPMFASQKSQTVKNFLIDNFNEHLMITFSEMVGSGKIKITRISERRDNTVKIILIETSFQNSNFETIKLPFSQGTINVEVTADGVKKTRKVRLN